MELIDKYEAIRIATRVSAHYVAIENTKASVRDIAEATGSIIVALNHAPLIEAEPVKHGRWIDDGDSILHCTSCHRYIRRIVPIGYDYCPHCGAKMSTDGKDGGENE